MNSAMSHADALILSCRNALARAEKRLAATKPDAYSYDRLAACVEHCKADLAFALGQAAS